MTHLLRALLTTLLLTLCLALPAQANTPVPADWRLQGEGKMRWFGLALYAARLWTPADQPLPSARAPAADQGFALELRYARDFTGARLVDASLDELRRLGWRDEAQLARWQLDLARVFPDVRAREVIVGRHLPGGRAEFFHQGRPTGTLSDATLATAFFGIWLDPRTREPALRASLVGSSASSPTP